MYKINPSWEYSSEWNLVARPSILERQDVVHKNSAAVAKIGRKSSRKYAVIESLPVTESIVETQSIPNISEAQKAPSSTKKREASILSSVAFL
jgi:hypothetical protein